MEFLEYNKREIQTHLLSFIFVSSLKLYYKEVLFVFFYFVKNQKSCKLVLDVLEIHNLRTFLELDLSPSQKHLLNLPFIIGVP